MKMEENWRTLGSHSDLIFNAMRDNITNAYGAIANNAKSSAEERLRAEQSMHDKIAVLNEQQFGKQVSIIDQIKSNWMGLSAIVYAFKQAFDWISTPFVEGFKAVETYNQSVASMAALVVTFTEKQKGAGLSDQWQEALKYSSAIVPVLENIAARTLLSGQQTTALANAFARSGVFLRENNAAQVEGFTRISNALPLMTQGQEIMRQINTEIRSVMTGANEQTSMMLTTLKSIDPQIESHLKTWREQGTVLENIGNLLVGFGPATALLENQWQAVKSTLDTTVTQILRGGMQFAYGEIINSIKQADVYLKDQKDLISGAMAVAWSAVSNAVGTVMGVLSGFGPILKDAGTAVGVIAYGWGGVLAVLKPVGEFLGTSISLTYELVKMIENAVVAGGALATGQLDVARVAWDEAKKNYSAVEVLSQKNRDILTDNIADSIAKYGLQTQAALDGAKKSYDGSAAFTAKKITDIGKAAAEIKKIEEKSAKELEESWAKYWADQDKQAADAQEYVGKEILKRLENEQKLTDQTAKELEKSWAIYRKNQADEEAMLWGVIGKTKLKAIEDDAKLSGQRIKAERDMYKDIRGYSTENYESALALIASQKAAYEKLKVDSVALDAWERNEKEKAFIAMGKSGDDFFNGISAGYLEMQRNAMTWGKAGYEIFNSFATNSYKTVSDVLFDGMTGQAKSFEEYWKSFSESLLRTLTDIIGKMIVQWGLYQAAAAIRLNTGAGTSFQNPFETGTGSGSGSGGIVSQGISLAGIASKGYTALSNWLGGGSSALATGEGAIESYGAAQAAADIAAYDAAATAAGEATIMSSSTAAGGSAAGGATAGASSAMAAAAPAAAAAIAAIVAAGFYDYYFGDSKPDFGTASSVEQQIADAKAYITYWQSQYDENPSDWEDNHDPFDSPVVKRDGLHNLKVNAENAVASGGSFQYGYEQIDATRAASILPLLEGYRTGLDYVPYDNFIAKLHKGERVQRAEENPFNGGSAGSGGNVTVQNHLYIDGKEIKILAERVVVERNRRGLGNSMTAVYA
ncbi:MAG: hypothetical protein WC750_06360 [Patescibacteria group bacterium]